VIMLVRDGSVRSTCRQVSAERLRLAHFTGRQRVLCMLECMCPFKTCMLELNPKGDSVTNLLAGVPLLYPDRNPG
jgi:hypothetical protein